MYESSWTTARTTSLASAAITGLIWLEAAYVVGQNAADISVDQQNVLVVFSLARYIITCIVSSAFSFLAIYGILSKRPSCVFPWIAIHFAVFAYTFSFGSFFLIWGAFDGLELNKILIAYPIWALLMISLAYMLGGMYVHFTRLYTKEPAEPVAPVKNEMLKMPGSKEIPYHSV